MTEKELNSVRELKKRIRDLELRLQALKTAAQNLVPVLDGLPHSNEVKSRVEKIALDLIETERELNNSRAQIILTKSELADKIIREVEDTTLQTLLILRYIECLSYEETARRMMITLRHAFRLHGRFLKDVTWLHSCALSES